MSRTIVLMAAEADSRRGRPRSEEAHQSVLDAVARLLDDQGQSYEELTVERIAAEAGVGKQTIYRWWKNKAAVVLESLMTGRLKLSFERVPNTGDLRADLTTWLDCELERSQMHDTEVMARSLMGALVTGGEETRQLFKERSVWDDMELTERIRQEAAAGGLREGVNPAAVASAIMDPFIIRLLTVGKPDHQWLQTQVDIVLRGVLRR
ncbi:TetR/AcrR family transcriptional regulator [Nesterenkonia natronophila]|uniref:TetR/AcrR family transcriptional regulator n=1 Tax=Nesterenkonia natronophila TaxID=2174932 RepID=A0A3A4FC83_9MICC|nr:TetR/AcrR family transcriptional regulator [Nesterenkonia natronophila]RJN32717.1 TetR/AcrR family transcriptional regulator [Nesterenkonia natronophila]